MIIMTKFQKRIKKLYKHPENCLIVGEGFGFLNEIIEIYKTVFVVSDRKPNLKSKNLVYREEFDDLSNLVEITAVFLDLSLLDKLETVMHIASRNKSFVIIEGNDPIGRDKSGPLYKTGYQCTGLYGSFHVWEF